MGIIRSINQSTGMYLKGQLGSHLGFHRPPSSSIINACLLDTNSSSRLLTHLLFVEYPIVTSIILRLVAYQRSVPYVLRHSFIHSFIHSFKGRVSKGKCSTAYRPWSLRPVHKGVKRKRDKAENNPVASLHSLLSSNSHQEPHRTSLSTCHVKPIACHL